MLLKDNTQKDIILLHWLGAHARELYLFEIFQRLPKHLFESLLAPGQRLQNQSWNLLYI
ncbi:hypothetical protein NADFUDRAFT_44894 [Nadsonia fulvescens var. elongata DSM 6958]|uniref:Uncharacterized protein n=1 Tax=Nadsonia fulvescens var. elongata DSM 6958 TaxID=857566 RepID=A0A1E3PS79_9ASCO|nr:hypothetical protein NADFUDRAFT_44894 [Nadsonia fulvescens var. elongata DSM 6958]